MSIKGQSYECDVITPFSSKIWKGCRRRNISAKYNFNLILNFIETKTYSPLHIILYKLLLSFCYIFQKTSKRMHYCLSHGKITICHVTFDVNSLGEIFTSTVWKHGTAWTVWCSHRNIYSWLCYQFILSSNSLVYWNMVHKRDCVIKFNMHIHKALRYQVTIRNHKSISALRLCNGLGCVHFNT